MNIILIFGSVLGLLSVVMAAYIDHSLGLHLTGKSLNAILTAVRYHQLYALVICIIALSLPSQKIPRIKSWLTRSGYIFSIGVIVFSFSIYLASIFNIPEITYLTPIGGLLLMIGWLCLIRTALFKMD